MKDETLRFACSHCRTNLFAPVSQRHVSGPCPVCGEILHAPSLPRSQERAFIPRKIIPDAGINFADLERRESWQTLRVLGMFLLVAAICYGGLQLLRHFHTA